MENFFDILQDDAVKLPDCLIFKLRPANTSNFLELEKFSKLFVLPNIMAQAIMLIPRTNRSVVSKLLTISVILISISLICFVCNSINSIN